MLADAPNCRPMAARGAAREGKAGAEWQGPDMLGVARHGRHVKEDHVRGLFFFPSMIPYRQRGEDSRFHRGNV